MSHISSAFSQDLRSQSAESANTSALSRDEAKNLFERTQQRWSQTNDQLISAIHQRTTSPLSPYDLRQKDSEITSLRRELTEIQAQMAQYQQQLQVAETTILQQQITIRNQSKAIENPRPGREHPLTPSRQRQQYNPYEYSQSHMTTQMSYGNPGHSDQHSQYGQMASLASRPAHPNTNLFGSPASHRNMPSGIADSSRALTSQNLHGPLGWQSVMPDPFGPKHLPSNSSGSSNGPQQFSNLSMYASPDSITSNPYPESSNYQSFAPTRTSNGNSEDDIRQGFQKLFDIVNAYARKYANFPSTIGDYAMPQEVKDRLLNASTTTTAFGLMSDQETRYLLISKIVIQWLIKHILKFSSFGGLDSQIDQIIAGAKGVIYQSTPAQLRYSLLTNIANEVQKLRSKPDFPAYLNHLSQQRATQLLHVIRPTMHQQLAGEWQDLVSILQEAYKLAELILTVTDEFSFEYPGYDCPFDENLMINIDPQMRGHSVGQLKSMQARVRLGSTPVVKIRKNSPQGVATEQVLVKSKVLLRKPR